MIGCYKKNDENYPKQAFKKAAETQAIADDAQRDLDEALPALVREISSFVKSAHSSDFNDCNFRCSEAWRFSWVPVEFKF